MNNVIHRLLSARTLRATVLTLSAVAASLGGSAQADGRCPGSLLLYPEFDNRAGVVTLLTVTNVHETSPVRVEFVYRGRFGANGQDLDCLESNYTRVLTQNDTFTTVTSAQNPNGRRGFVYVFAKDIQDNKIVHNWLIGQTIVLNGVSTREYSINAVSYEGIGDGSENFDGMKLTDVDGDGLADLNGCEYQKSANALIFPRFFGQQPGVNSDLILVALSGGRAFETTVDFLMYNDNEEVFSREYNFRCWDRVSLLTISNLFSNDFLQDQTNHDPGEIVGQPDQEAGWLWMKGAVANSINSFIQDPAVYGVLVEYIGGKPTADLPFEDGLNGNGDLYPVGITGDPVEIPCR